MADYDGLNTRGWFETDDDHEEFEALMRHQKKIMEDWHNHLGRRKGMGYTMLIGAPVVSLVAVIRDVDWAGPIVMVMLAVAIYCFYSLVEIQKMIVQKAKDHSFAREIKLGELLHWPEDRGARE